MLEFDKRGGLVRKEVLKKLGDLLAPEIEEMKKVCKKRDYADRRCSILLPDEKSTAKIQKLARKKAKGLDILVVIGIGGMHLGTAAVHEAVNDRRYNQLTGVKPRVYFAETTDAGEISNILEIAEESLKKGEKLLVNICSKSGKTAETIINARIFLNLLQKFKKPFKEHVVITTGYSSPLRDFANDNGIDCLEIPANIGGRYSVLSPAGIFPLEAIGIDTSKLLKGAKKMRDRCLSGFFKNPAAQSAVHLFFHSQQNRKIHTTFVFSKELETLGKWYRQLTAESLGKNGKGITPIVSTGTSDLHSMVQLYLGGPNDKFTTFITLKKGKKDIKIPAVKGIEDTAKGKTLSFVMNAMFQSTIKAYQKRNRPFAHIEMPGRDEFSIGEFLQMKMMEIMFLAELMGVNAFNQPNVEDYKSEARQLLSD